MKYLGEETKVEVKTKSVRKVLYIRCDGCGKKIMPSKFRNEKSSYVYIHTWHNSWGNDSIDSHEYGDYCKECAKTFLSQYIDEMKSTADLELEHKHLWENDTYDDYDEDDYDSEYDLAENDDND